MFITRSGPWCHEFWYRARMPGPLPGYAGMLPRVCGHAAPGMRACCPGMPWAGVAAAQGMPAGVLAQPSENPLHFGRVYTASTARSVGGEQLYSPTPVPLCASVPPLLSVIAVSRAGCRPPRPPCDAGGGGRARRGAAGRGAAREGRAERPQGRADAAWNRGRAGSPLGPSPYGGCGAVRPRRRGAP